MDPKKAGCEPKAERLIDDDSYWWCACGHSQNQPFCDGSHRQTEMGPVPFTPERSGEAWLCMCKRTKTPPYCDGTHHKLDNKK